MIEIDKFITINGVQITEKSDFEIKYQLLTKNGATVIRNQNGSITITGPFSIIYQESDDDFFRITNSGIINIRSDNTAILHSFNNLASGTLHVASGCLEKIFSTSNCVEPDKYIQEKIIKSVNQLVL